MSDDGLFDLEGSPLRPGEEVVVQTIWGDEKCTVRKIGTEDGYPIVELDTEKGDRITVNVARVRRAES